MRRLLVLCFVLLLSGYSNGQAQTQFTVAGQPASQMILEAYNWSGTTITGSFRNVGPAAINIGACDAFVNGLPAAMAVSMSAIMPQQSTMFTITVPASGTFTSGAAYTLKIVTPDGGVFAYSLVCGGSGTAPMTQMMPTTTTQIQQQPQQPTTVAPSTSLQASFPSWAFLMIIAIAGAVLLIAVILGLVILFRPRRDQRGFYP